MKSALTLQGHRLPALDEGLEFLRLIWAIDHGLTRTSRRMQATFGVTGPQRLVIRLLGRFPGMTAGQLAEVLEVHRSTVSGILLRLQRGGHLRRRLDPRDRRRAYLVLTPKGQALNAEAKGTVEEAVRAALAGIPESKLSLAREVLARVADALALGTLPGRRAAVQPRKRSA